MLLTANYDCRMTVNDRAREETERDVHRQSVAHVQVEVRTETTLSYRMTWLDTSNRMTDRPSRRPRGVRRYATNCLKYRNHGSAHAAGEIAVLTGAIAPAAGPRAQPLWTRRKADIIQFKQTKRTDVHALRDASKARPTLRHAEQWRGHSRWCKSRQRACAGDAVHGWSGQTLHPRYVQSEGVMGRYWIRRWHACSRQGCWLKYAARRPGSTPRGRLWP